MEKISYSKLVYENPYVIKFATILFWLAFVSELIFFSVKKLGFSSPHETLLLRIICLFFCIKIILTKYNKLEWLTIILLGTLGISAYFFSGRGIDIFFRAITMVCASKNISRLKAFKFLLISISFVYLWTLFQGFTGQKMLVDVRDYGRNMIEARYTFGFSHANIFHFTTWSIIIIFIYIYHKYLKVSHYVLLSLLNFIILYFTRSRTGFLVLAMSLILFAIFFHSKHTSYIAGYLNTLGFIVFISCIFLSIATIIWGTSSSILNKINSLFTGRILWANYEAKKSFLSLFSYQGNDLLIDMGWVRLIYSFGIIPAIIYTTTVVLLLWDISKSRDYAAFTFLISTIVYMTVEAQQVNSDIVFNHILLLCFGKWPDLIQIPFNLLGKLKNNRIILNHKN